MVALLVRGDGAKDAWVRAPHAIAPRAWVLGVVALQVRVEAGRLRARLRRHATGWNEAEVAELHPPAIVHVSLVDGEPPEPPRIDPAPLDGSAAQLELFVDGEPTARASLARVEAGVRAFGHVFCRWLADGGEELGCDLTDFLALPEGVKFERLAVPRLRAGQTASYALAVAGARS